MFPPKKQTKKAGEKDPKRRAAVSAALASRREDPASKSTPKGRKTPFDKL